VNTCELRYPSKLIEAGTPVGAIGALSIGEPVAQMTLETFPFAGDATMSILYLIVFFTMMIINI
jgi:DNA-directed RNA polymerase III subunit RPC1